MSVGEELPFFHDEVVLKTAPVYRHAFRMVRWIGGRSVAQLATVEC